MSDWFWNPNFWLPVNFTWKDIAPTEENQYPNTKDICIYPFIISFVLLYFRNEIFHKYLGFYVASYYGLTCTKPAEPEHVKKLEKIFQRYDCGTNVPKIVKERASEKLNWKLKDVEIWLYQRKASTKIPQGVKFSETLFLAISRFGLFTLGLVVLSHKEWFTDISYCWEGYPYHQLDTGVWYYYVISLSFFWYALITQMTDLKSKPRDWLALYAHHFCTILLVLFSFTLNLIRVGSLVMFLHEIPDWILLTAKLGHLSDHDRFTEMFFACSVLAFFIARLIIYPFYIMKGAIFVAPTYMFMPAGYLFYVLLFGILILNIIWMYLMISVIYYKFTKGKLEDIRESEDMTAEYSDN